VAVLLLPSAAKALPKGVVALGDAGGAAGGVAAADDGGSGDAPDAGGGGDSTASAPSASAPGGSTASAGTSGAAGSSPAASAGAAVTGAPGSSASTTARSSAARADGEQQLAEVIASQHDTLAKANDQDAAGASGGASGGRGDAARAGAGQALRVAVYDYELADVDPGIGGVVTDSTLAEMRKLAGVSAIGMAEIRDMLSHEATKQLVGCDNESCLAEVAGALGVDELVSGKLAKVSDGEVFILRRIDQRRARVAGVVNKRLAAGSGQELLAAVGPAIEELYPERPLREGLTRGVAKEVALRLDPPPLPRWPVFGVGTLAVVAGGAAGLFGMLARNAESSFNTQMDLARTQVLPGRTLVNLEGEANRNAKYSQYSLIGAGSLALTAGIMALFTDWYGYAEAARTSGGPAR